MIKLTFKPKNQSLLKLGRRFYLLSKRYNAAKYDYKVINLWIGTHEQIVALEKCTLKTFEKFLEFGPQDFLGLHNEKHYVALD